MLRKYALFIGVAALGALVTSCGDDDTGTPTPTPSGTATPTPTPSQSQVEFDLTQAFTAQSTNANTIAAFFTPNAGGEETFNAASRVNGNAQVALAFSPESVNFFFPDRTDAVTFSGSDFVGVSGTERTYARGDEKLALELPFEHTLRVQYEEQLAFTRNTVAGTLRPVRTALFFNPVTTTSAIDTDLAYDGSVYVAGGDPGVTESGTISADDITFTINEADDSVSGTIDILETVNGTTQTVATLVFQRTVDSSNSVTGGVVGTNNTFSGILTDTTNKFEGNFAGSLSGPNREEIFLLFSISGNENTDDDRRFVGSFIGKR
ncbi:hypothetical protein [Aurantiacibacter poecillastricola]|uniref:hypothetical protein n=1 Tax=Aurantiacibacter poecillastricola TaxID=3064385 RepID=UPI00273E2A9D|nr:hypothetical protein [Aurantiacibacter sp. 219JJ12-13]MDP5263460.1 hypothetical protein [Aurantiacibacter sp. 219JJ12-13]